MFDGRIAEDFKLATGTFVSVGPLRAKIIAAGAPCVQDVVIAGINRDEVGALLFPRLDECRELAGLPADAPPAAGAAPARRCALLPGAASTDAGASGTGSANRVARAARCWPSRRRIDKGEVTDKGSINQRAVLTHRAALVEALHAGTAARHIAASRQGDKRMKIQGQAALVTGGASGLGEATARELARLGAKVAVLDVNARTGATRSRPRSAASPCQLRHHQHRQRRRRARRRPPPRTARRAS